MGWYLKSPLALKNTLTHQRKIMGAMGKYYPPSVRESRLSTRLFERSELTFMPKDPSESVSLKPGKKAIEKSPIFGRPMG